MAGATLSHQEAREILRTAFRKVVGTSPSESELTIVQAIADFETGYGRAGQFSSMAAQGMYNWGALQKPRNADGSCPTGTAPGMDAGNARCFYVFSTDEEAAAMYLSTLIGTAVARLTPRNLATRAALKTGVPMDVAYAMKTPPAYFEADASAYGAGITARAQTIIKALGLPPLSATSGMKKLGWGAFILGVLGLGAAGAGAWFGTKKISERTS